MTLTLSDIKDLIAFGREQGLQSVSAEGVSIVYGGVAPIADETQASDASMSNLPEELRHYSAVGKIAFGKR